MRRQLQRRNLQQKRNSVVNRSQGTLSKGDEEMGSEIIQDEEAMKRIEELVVSDRSSTMLVCIQDVYKRQTLSGASQPVVCIFTYL